MNFFKSFLKDYAHNLLVVFKGFGLSVIGFANITAILFGYDCFSKVSTSEGWTAIGYLLASLSMIVLFVIISFLGGIFVSRYQNFSKKK